MPVPAFEHDQQGDLGSRLVSVNGALVDHASLLSWNSLASATNLPSTSVKAGMTRSGRPVGVQVLAPYLEDLTALRMASHIQRITGGFEVPALAR
jgi:amidase